jgi:hypothetical protein
VGSITAGNSVTFTYTTRLTSETVSQITGGGTTTTTTEVVRQSPTKSETPPPPSPPQQASAPPPSEARTLNVSKAEGGTPIMAALRSDGGAAEAKAIGMQTIVREAAPPSSEAAGLRPGEGSSAPSRSADAAPSLSPVLSAPADGGFRTAVLSGVSGIATGETIVVAKPIGEVIQLNRVSFAIPADAFAVARADSQVVLQATLADGRPLPVWLKFNPGTGRFEGTPPSGERGSIDIKVSARDSTGGQATQVFKMEVRGQGADAGTAVPTSRHAFAGKAGLAEQIRTARATAGRAARAG